MRLRHAIAGWRLKALMPLIVASAVWCAEAENLLANPGFERVDGEMPARWNLFVMPMDGAEGRLDSTVPLEGRFAAMLHIPEPYPKEPCNNWSQNIIAELDGKELRVKGNIRTEGATEAAIWLQCYRKRPQTLLLLASTSTDSPLYGTKDWTPVEMKVNVPRGTDFIVLRCVLIGRGTAWFDSVVVDDGDSDDDESEDEVREPHAGLVLGGVERKALLEAHEAMVEANRAMRETNKVLSERIAQLQEELLGLRERLATVKDELASAPTSHGVPITPAAPAVLSTPSGPAPPLVPHGYAWGENSP